MDSTRFDRLAKSFSRRLTRRETLVASTAALTTFGLATKVLAAQEATPDASPDAVELGPSFLFVQLAERGSWMPKPDEPGIYLLTLYGASNQTVYFSDRPDRIVGTVPTERFLGALGFTPSEPPNAAAVVQTPDGERDVLVVELFNPVYIQGFGENGADALTYEAKVLAGYQGEGLAKWVPLADDDQLPQDFTQISLFIDDCADMQGCYIEGMGGPGSYVGPIPGGPYGRCWDWGYITCMPCSRAGYKYYDKMCNDTYPTCQGYCITNTCWLGIC